MNIPKSFMLGGITITVEEDEALKKKGAIGEARYTEQKILIAKDIAPLESTEQAFLHELTHYILFLMNEDDLRNNEAFVDIFAHLLYQALKTGEYGKTQKRD